MNPEIKTLYKEISFKYNISIDLVKKIVDSQFKFVKDVMASGIKNQPKLIDDKLIPIEKFNMKFMSFGFLNNENSPAIWRGPMVSRMTQQFFDKVEWGDLDYLILDLPPGTGDIQLTLVQKIALSGAIMVTTPQDLSLIDVKKGSDMFKKVNTPIIGVVENMVGTTLSGKISNVNIKSLIFHHKTSSKYLTLVTWPLKISYGLVEIADNNTVISFAEKPKFLLTSIKL